jgi:hypothetical protein
MAGGTRTGAGDALGDRAVDAELAAQAGVFAGRVLQPRAGDLQLVLEVVDLVLLVAELALEQLLVEIALAAGDRAEGHERCTPPHPAGPRDPRTTTRHDRLLTGAGR